MPLPREGRSAVQLAERAITDAGFVIVERNRRVRKTAVTVSFVATDAAGDTWWFDVGGSFTSHRGGLLGADTVWRSLGRACAVQAARADVPLVLLTTDLPRRPSEGDTALRAAGCAVFLDAIDLFSSDAVERLRRYAKGGCRNEPGLGFWTPSDLAGHASASS